MSTVNQKDNHLAQLKNRLIAENMKKYIENVGITIKKA